MGIFDVFTTDAQDNARNDQVQGINAGLGSANNYLGAGRNQLNTNYGDALSAFAPAQSIVNGTGTSGYNAYADATGANGSAGLQRADQLFTQTPGYQEGIKLALDNNDARAASRGMLASGNTDVDTTKLANDYASQKYGQYVAGLAPFTSVPGQATAVASGVAGVDTGLGNQLASNYGQTASLNYGGQTSIGNANASADLASLTASGNIMNAIMQGAKLVAGGAGGFGGSGGGGSTFLPSSSFLDHGFSFG